MIASDGFTFQVVPWSGIVGGGIMVLAPDGHCVGQLIGMVQDRDTFTADAQKEIWAKIAKALNAVEPD